MTKQATGPTRKTKGRTKIIVVAQQKGGVGKTTVSKILTEGTVLSGYRGLAVDLDPQANFSARLIDMDLTDGKRPPVHPSFDPNANGDGNWAGRSSSADIFKENMLVLPYPTRLNGLQLIPADSQQLRRLEPEARQLTLAVSTFLNTPAVQRTYDFIIIDTPPSQGVFTVAAIRAATHMLVPVVMEPQSLEGLHDMIAFWRRENRLREKERIEMIGVLPNKVDPRTALHMGYLHAWRDDEGLGPLILPFELNQRIVYAELDDPTTKPDSIFKLPTTNAARQEAERLRAYFIDRVFRHRKGVVA